MCKQQVSSLRVWSMYGLVTFITQDWKFPVAEGLLAGKKPVVTQMKKKERDKKCLKLGFLHLFVKLGGCMDVHETISCIYNSSILPARISQGLVLHVP